MGGSGMTAAMSVAEELYKENGNDPSRVNVLGIEKAGKLGGTSALTSSPMAVNKDGNRFTDESGLAMMDPWKAGPNFYSIWSDDRIKNIQENGFEYVSTGLFINQGVVPANTPISEIYNVLDVAIEQGYVYKADTIEELTKKLGMDSNILKKNKTIKLVMDLNR